MPKNDDTITFQKKELSGSRLRCLMLTSLPDQQVAEFLTGLVHPYATVATTDKWMPRGFLKPEEAKLGETLGFLSDKDRAAVTGWWLAVTKGANTPNWDIVSTCQFSDGNQTGLILVEAKAHEGELNVTTDSCGSGNAANQKTIAAALTEATTGLNAVVHGWSFSPNRCYQLSNRFAWARKVASFGVPVILVYLGFLNASEMEDGKRTILTSAKQWHDCVLSRSEGIVPSTVWNQQLEIGSIPLITLIRTADVNVSAALQARAIST